MSDPKEMQSDEYKKKFDEGPVGVITIYGKVSMGRNLGLTFVYFLVVSFSTSRNFTSHVERTS